MELKDLEAFQNVPFLSWVKDGELRYLWGNQAFCDLAGEKVVGKKDEDLVWKDNAEVMVANDMAVLESGKPHYLKERANHPEHGEAIYSVCKWVDSLDGRTAVLGIAILIPD